MDPDSDGRCTSDEEAGMQHITRLKSVIANDNSISAWSGAPNFDSTAPTTTNPEPESIISKLETALRLNKLQEEKLARLEKIFAARLKECRERLASIRRGCIKTSNEEDTFNIFHCGKPYFKDSNFIAAPDNEDTIAMRDLGMFDFFSVRSVPGWTVTDKNKFCEVMLKMSRAIKKEQLRSLLNQYNREAEDNDIKSPLQKKIDVAISEVKQLERRDLSQLAMPIEYEYDWEAVAKQLRNRHSAMEYRGLWRVFLHPSINKSSWTPEETHRLQTIVQANNLRNWDKIAKELNTGRSQYQCFVYYRTNMLRSDTGKKWTSEEEEYLKRLVEHYRQGSYIPWNKITHKMRSRTKLQIYNKYIRSLNKKGRFLPEEDAVLLTCVKSGTDFRHILKYLNGRSLHQVKSRHKVLVSNANRISTVWTVEEDRKLVQLMANQDASLNYANIVKHFPGKERTTIRTRYNTLVKWMKQHPKESIENAPRRGARRLTHGRAASDLTNALIALKKRMESESITQPKKLKINEKSSQEVIDDAITVTLVNELNYEEHVSSLQDFDMVPQASATNTDPPGPSTKSSTTNLHKLLLLLGSRMDKSNFEQKVTRAPRFSSLKADDEETSRAEPPTFKTYSKKRNVASEKNKEKLSVWGSEHTLEATKYVLPPNFATITGCKKLVAYGNSNTTYNFTKDLSIFKRNRLFKEHWTRFMDRFHLLFTWPMLLSNAPPTESNRRMACGTHVEQQQLELGVSSLKWGCVELSQ